MQLSPKTSQPWDRVLNLRMMTCFILRETLGVLGARRAHTATRHCVPLRGFSGIFLTVCTLCAWQPSCLWELGEGDKVRGLHVRSVLCGYWFTVTEDVCVWLSGGVLSPQGLGMASPSLPWMLFPLLLRENSLEQSEWGSRCGRSLKKGPLPSFPLAIPPFPSACHHEMMPQGGPC